MTKVVGDAIEPLLVSNEWPGAGAELPAQISPASGLLGSA